MYVSAIWGPDAANFRVWEHETPEDAQDRVTANCRYLQQAGYVYAGRSDVNGLTSVKYQHPETGSVRETGYWWQEAGAGNGNPGHCEAAYLSCE